MEWMDSVGGKAKWAKGYAEVDAEGSKYWLRVLSEIKNRGTQEVCIVVCDGLKGLPTAIESAWPR
jgi:transposase-like protein